MRRAAPTAVDTTAEPAPHPADDPAGDPADDLVVLLDDDGRPRGTAPRATVHGLDTRLHLAFSVHLVDDAGRTLLTRRALGKKAWPGVWTGSACGHPRPGEDPVDAVVRRVVEELGVEPTDLRVVLPHFRYRAVDASGIVEHEICPVSVGRVADPDALRPDPAEVAEHAWVAWADLYAAVRHTPFLLSPWTVLQVRQLGPAGPAVSGAVVGS